MLRKELSLKHDVIGRLIKGRINRKDAGVLLDCSAKTISRYITKVQEGGLEALIDRRHSNSHKLTPTSSLCQRYA